MGWYSYKEKGIGGCESTVVFSWAFEMYDRCVHTCLVCSVGVLTHYWRERIQSENMPEGRAPEHAQKAAVKF